jgi:hypothetical protein
MKINILIVQPYGYVHSLGFMDSARLMRYHFRRHGIETNISRNKPDRSAVNIVLGAHLGVPTEWLNQFAYVLFNQEQLGDGGSSVSENYRSLLRNSHVIDYDPANQPAYNTDTPVIRAVLPLGHAPYLEQIEKRVELEARPIDLLFIGSMNQFRREMIQRIETLGIDVAFFDHATYGPERDEYIQSAKAVLNIPFYDSNRFEQTRVFNALSLGTPVVSLRRPGLQVGPAYQEAVHWFSAEDVETYFTSIFLQHTWFDRSREMMDRWRQSEDFSANYGQVISLLQTVELEYLHRSCPSSQTAVRLNMSPQRGYRIDWTHVSCRPSFDWSHLDLTGSRFRDEVRCIQEDGQEIQLRAGKIEAIYAYDEGWSDIELRTLLGNAMHLLESGGIIVLDQPLGVFENNTSDVFSTQARSVSRLRLIVEDQLRFNPEDTLVEMENVEWLTELAVAGGGILHLARFKLKKRQMTPREKVIARTYRADFSDWPEETTSNRASVTD